MINLCQDDMEDEELEKRYCYLDIMINATTHYLIYKLRCKQISCLKGLAFNCIESVIKICSKLYQFSCVAIISNPTYHHNLNVDIRGLFNTLHLPNFEVNLLPQNH